MLPWPIADGIHADRIHLGTQERIAVESLDIVLPTNLPIPLYHGTSSLFLQGIIRSGLGGANPLADWKVLEFARLIYPLVEKHLSAQEDFMVKSQSFRFMVEQKSASSNFQHGETYLSPTLSTAVRYAANKRLGSELLTYTLDFLSELIRLKVPGLSDKLYQDYPQILEKLDISAAPLLIQAENVDPAALVAENGGDAALVLKHVLETVRSSPENYDLLLQQSNFRLRRPVPAAQLRIWLINVVRWDPFAPTYSLYSLSTREAAPGSLREAMPPDV